MGDFDGSRVGVQVLTSPSNPLDMGVSIRYAALLEDFDQVRRTVAPTHKNMSMAPYPMSASSSYKSRGANEKLGLIGGSQK